MFDEKEISFQISLENHKVFKKFKKYSPNSKKLIASDKKTLFIYNNTKLYSINPNNPKEYRVSF